MKKSAKNDGQFRTHIAEPRWQQVVSVIIALAAVLAWVALIVFRHGH